MGTDKEAGLGGTLRQRERSRKVAQREMGETVGRQGQREKYSEGQRKKC